MRKLLLPYKDAQQMFRRMVFNVLSRNCDDHTKNFAFLLKENGNWELSPAYDICYAYRPDSQWVSQQTLSINGKRTSFQNSDFIELATSMNIKNPQQIIEEVRSVIAQWNTFANSCGVSTSLKENIEQNLLYRDF